MKIWKDNIWKNYKEKEIIYKNDEFQQWTSKRSISICRCCNWKYLKHSTWEDNEWANVKRKRCFRPTHFKFEYNGLHHINSQRIHITKVSFKQDNEQFVRILISDMWILTSILCNLWVHAVFIHCSQLDSRLTKVPPARATISAAPIKEPGDFDESALRRTILKNVSAGKSTPYTKVELKVHNEFQVRVRSSSLGFTSMFRTKNYSSQFPPNFRFKTISHLLRLDQFAK